MLLSRKIPCSPSVLQANFSVCVGSRIKQSLELQLSCVKPPLISSSKRPNFQSNNFMELKLIAVPSIVMDHTLILFSAHRSRILDHKQFKSSAFTSSTNTYSMGYFQCPWKLSIWNVVSKNIMWERISWLRHCIGNPFDPYHDYVSDF